MSVVIIIDHFNFLDNLNGAWANQTPSGSSISRSVAILYFVCFLKESIIIKIFEIKIT